MAATLFNDLGTTSPIYNTGVGAGISGVGQSATQANLFTVSGSGNDTVTQIDLAVGNLSGLNTFYAAIWTDNGGLPGSQVVGAFWSLSASTPAFTGLVSVTDITGVTLAGGQQYFMILGPLSLTDGSDNVWAWNNQGVTGLSLSSLDGGSSWINNGILTTGAFDVLGTASAVPEPGTIFMLATGLLALVSLRKRLR